jgi:hypothetical protein
MPSDAALTPMSYCGPTVFSAECIAGAAYNAGIRDKPTLERAVAIAFAESSGKVKIVNSIGCCVGLWQINVKAHKQYSTAQMQDPQQNANAMFSISNNGRNWGPWEAFTNKSYLIFIPQAKIGVATLDSKITGGIESGNNNPLLPDAIEGPLDGAQAAAGAISDLAQFPAKILAWITDRNNIIRLVKVGAGLAIAIVGISIVSRPIVKPMVETVGKVAGVVGPGKAASVVKKVT